jgi:hypothetical protein
MNKQSIGEMLRKIDPPREPWVDYLLSVKFEVMQ